MQYSFFSSDVEKVLTTRYTWYIKVLQNPNWISGSTLLVMIYNNTCLRISLSKISHKIDKKRIKGKSSGLSSWAKRINFENVHKNGNYMIAISSIFI